MIKNNEEYSKLKINDSLEKNKTIELYFPKNNNRKLVRSVTPQHNSLLEKEKVNKIMITECEE